MARLGEVCEINPKMPSFNDETLVSFVTMSDVSENGQINTSITRLYGEVKKGFTCFQEGDVLFAKITPCMENGKGALAIGLKNGIGCGSTEFHVLRSNPHVLDNRWLYYLTAHSAFRKEAERHMTGSAGQKRVPKSFLEKHEFTVPSLDEQRQHVKTLDLLENTIDLRKKQLQKLDDLVKSRFVEMFGDPKINPYNYLVASLGEHITFLTSGSRGWAKYCVEDGKEWFITIKNVKDCAISVENMQSINAPSGAEAERTRVQEGDLLISITADLGRTGVVTKHIAEHGAYINQHLTCIRLDMKVLNPLYVAYFMETPAGKEQFEAKNQSAVKAGLNFNSINSLRIMIPPIDKQNEFVTFVKHVDKSRLTIQDGLNRMELLKQSLMQKYFG